MRKPRHKFAVPDPERDKAALREHYVNDYLPSDDDEEGLGPQGISKLGELARVLRELKR